MRALVMFGVVVALSGCGVLQSGRNLLSGQPRATFDGNYYPARLKKGEEDTRQFVVTVGKVSQGVDGAKEAARYEASKYCLRQHGWSGIDWRVGPDSPNGALTVREDTLTFSGECRGWV